MNKKIDFNSCTNCGDCIQFCPTDAIFYTDDKVEILFQESKCIACKICNDICKVNSITDDDNLDLISLAFGRAKSLVKHNLVICKECKNPFSKKKEEVICQNCIAYIDEWKDIFTLAKDV